MGVIKSANLHIIDECNYRCKFCFSSGKGCSSPGKLEKQQWKWIIGDLVNRGIEKISFVGGEPLLHPDLEELLRFAKDKGVVTAVITNGSLVDKDFFIRTYGTLDWIGLSIDSTDDYNEVILGRYSDGCRHLDNVRAAASLAHNFGVKLKINVTVNRLCYFENFKDLIKELNPDRVKFMQLAHISGINDDAYTQLSLTKGSFEDFRRRHSNITLKNGLHPAFETEDDISNSYLMIDKSGHFRMNGVRGYSFIEYSDYWKNGGSSSIDERKYIRRGGIYEWGSRMEDVYD